MKDFIIVAYDNNDNPTMREATIQNVLDQIKYASEAEHRVKWNVFKKADPATIHLKYNKMLETL